MRTPELAAGCNKPASEPRESIEVQRKHKGVAREGVEALSERTSVLGASRSVKSAEGREPKEEPHESHRLATDGHRYERVSEGEAKERRLREDFNRNLHKAASDCESLEGPSERMKVEKDAAKPNEPLTI